MSRNATSTCVCRCSYGLLPHLEMGADLLVSKCRLPYLVFVTVLSNYLNVQGARSDTSTNYSRLLQLNPARLLKFAQTVANTNITFVPKVTALAHIR